MEIDPSELSDSDFEDHIKSWMEDSLHISSPAIDPVLTYFGIGSRQSPDRPFRKDLALELIEAPEKLTSTANLLINIVNQWSHYFPYVDEIDSPTIQYNLNVLRCAAQVESMPALLMLLKNLNLVVYYEDSPYGQGFMSFTLAPQLFQSIREAWLLILEDSKSQSEAVKHHNRKLAHTSRLRTYLDQTHLPPSENEEEVFNRYLMACKATGLDLQSVVQAELSLLRTASFEQPLTIHTNFNPRA